jgi:hypothetical protein
MSLVAAASPIKPVHGVNGSLSVTISATETEFEMRQVDFNYEVAAEDITHSGANGWQVMMAGIRKISGTITFVYDLANAPFGATPYNLKAGGAASLKLTFNTHLGANLAAGDITTPDVWAGPAYLKNFHPKTGPQAGPMECTIDFESTGAWTGTGI